VAELADAQASGACARKGVGVQVPPRALPSGLLTTSGDGIADPIASLGHRVGLRESRNQAPARWVSAGAPSGAIAPSDDHRTFPPVTTNGMALKARASIIADKIRGAGDPDAGAAQHTRPLLEVVRTVRPTRAGSHAPTTRTIDDKGRVRVLIGPGRVPLADALGCGPGPLEVHRDGIWLLLRPGAGMAKQRHDGLATLAEDGRLRLPRPVLAELALRPGDELALVVLGELGVIAVCNPARLFDTAAPAALVGAACGPATATGTVERRGPR
jgi:hypothetical protein